ncbi:MAG: hypothetical protein HYZ50_05930 [Deltaproteobacteria bacterium]|nr:hypothetical protein [Deltaproteobacteria bacterium]
MVIAGEWQLRDDGAARPTVRAQVLGRDGSQILENFLIDSGADRTVLSAFLMDRLHLPTQNAQPDFTLSGIGGTSGFVLVTTVLEFIRDDGGPVSPRRVCRFYRPSGDGLERSRARYPGQLRPDYQSPSQ